MKNCLTDKQHHEVACNIVKGMEGIENCCRLDVLTRALAMVMVIARGDVSAKEFCSITLQMIEEDFIKMEEVVSAGR
jgi:hypothetical protein